MNLLEPAVLISYFTVLVVLAVYGVHRYYLTYLYIRNRHRLPRPQGTFHRLPRLTVQLPIFN
ncbi:MAG: glycosyl transferase family 2, partial [Acidobacteria bacterium]|nr:glycosyl transferase family 2 [Acidobacteriota bacterium]